MVRAGSGQEPQAMKRNCHFFCVCLLCLFVAYCICLFVCWAINAPDDGKELPDQRFHNEENYHFSELLDRNDDAGDDDETGRKWGQQQEGGEEVRKCWREETLHCLRWLPLFPSYYWIDRILVDRILVDRILVDRTHLTECLLDRIRRKCSTAYCLR